MLELDHAICFVPGLEALDLGGLTIEPGMVHSGQGTRNVRVLFERNYLEVAWIERPEEVRARGLDFIGRCARPNVAYPFGCVLRGDIPTFLRERLLRYEMPGAPGFVLQLLADQAADAPFVAIVETADPSARWPIRRAAPRDLAHPSGVTSLTRVTFSCPSLPRLPEIADVRFVIGEPALRLELGSVERSFIP